MFLYEHRVNTSAHLARVPVDRGVEVDLRDYDGAIRLAHDPFTGGEPLEAFLDQYRHASIIFNTKSDGLEERVIAMARARGIEDWWFLDLANPTLVRLARAGERRLAVRYSEFEPIESALAFAGLAEWVWVDCFTHLPITPEVYGLLRSHFKICLVSPELQKHPRSEIQRYRELLRDMPIDAVCSDFCDDWTVP
jgi:hypothetical protein